MAAMLARTAKTILVWVMRVNGALACLAVIAVVMPTAWIDAGSRASGFGPFPDTVLNQYLVRSLSTIYALLGVFVLYLANDARRYRDLIIFVGRITMVLGIALTGLDFAIGMPVLWSWIEGPPTILVGWAFVWFAQKAFPRGSRERPPS